MRPIALRRAVSFCILALIAVVVIGLFVVRKGTLRPDGFFSVWVLLGLIVFLAIYNVRKTLPFLPLGSSAAWLQVHIYCGFLTFLLFAIHVRFSVPNGIFECVVERNVGVRRGTACHNQRPASAGAANGSQCG